MRFTAGLLLASLAIAVGSCKGGTTRVLPVDRVEETARSAMVVSPAEPGDLRQQVFAPALDSTEKTDALAKALPIARSTAARPGASKALTVEAALPKRATPPVSPRPAPPPPPVEPPTIEPPAPEPSVSEPE